MFGDFPIGIQAISDIHAEFHTDQGERFVSNLDATDTTVLVIAGDLALANMYQNLIPILVEKFPHVVSVLGNHEFYGSNRPAVLAEMARLHDLYPNFHPLENQTVTIEGQRFVGTTMWFPDDPAAYVYQRMLNDFGIIDGFRTWVYSVNQEAVEFLTDTVQPGDVVVTHHVPTQKGSRPRWIGSPLQPFYVCEMDEMILDNRPALWVYGHTHDSHDFVIGDTRLWCNPYGYFGSVTNPDFIREVLETK